MHWYQCRALKRFNRDWRCGRGLNRARRKRPSEGHVGLGWASNKTLSARQVSEMWKLGKVPAKRIRVMECNSGTSPPKQRDVLTPSTSKQEVRIAVPTASNADLNVVYNKWLGANDAVLPLTLHFDPRTFSAVFIALVVQSFTSVLEVYFRVEYWKLKWSWRVWCNFHANWCQFVRTKQRVSFL